MKSIQSEINIGLVGHVDHGKTTLTKSLSGIWTDKHSEEIRRGISIRLGYADCDFYKCPKCKEPKCYGTFEKCPHCGGKSKLLRRISFVDAPGHESLMAVMLSGAAIIDGALLVIAANEPCPQAQTEEHLLALDISGVKDIVVAQNKVDLVSPEEALENYQQIKNFLKGTVAENAPIVPIAAHYDANVDALIQAIEKGIPTPKRDLRRDPRMYVARSFDINHPGTKVKDIRGGVVGGSVLQGKLKVGDGIEFCPGIKKGKSNNYESIKTKIISLNVRGKNVEEIQPGGLVGIGTELDPSITKSDNIAGNVIGFKEKLPQVYETLTAKVHLFQKLRKTKGALEVKPLKGGEPLMLSVGSAVTLGLFDAKENKFNLKIPVCAQAGQRIAISRRFGARWHLIGYGVIK